jgi:hypothetical protein
MSLFSDQKENFMKDFLSGFYDHVNTVESNWKKQYDTMIFIQKNMKMLI